MGNCCGPREIGAGATILHNPRLQVSKQIGFEACKKKFVDAGQGHIFDFIDMLNSTERKDFVQQLEHVDPDEIHQIYMDLCTGQQPESPSKFFPVDPSLIQQTSDEDLM